MCIRDSFDLGPYDAWWLDTPLWTLSALPRLGTMLTEENMESLKDVIDSCLADERFEAGRREVKAETWCHAGEGASRVADYLITKHNELTSK